MKKIKLSGEKPVWLKSWPDMEQLNFPHNMKVMAVRLLNIENNLVLHLTDKSLSATIGSHRCIWALQPDGKWKRSCTCKYINDKCVHAYVAHLMLKQTCIECEWELSGGQARQNMPQQHPASTAPRPVSQTQYPGTQIQRPAVPARPPSQVQYPGAQMPRPAAPVQPPQFQNRQQPQRQFPQNSSQMSFFNELEGNSGQWRQQFKRPIETVPSPVKAVPVPTTLTVELEFSAGYRGMRVRFYFTSNGMRRLMDVAKVRYIASLLQPDGTGSRDTEHLWSKQDRDFLLWLHPILRNRTAQGYSHNFLTVSPSERHEWFTTWAQVPGRFIEKNTQEPFNPLNITRFASMHFELTRQGENLRVFPVIMGSDGSRHFIHKLFKAVNEDVTGYTREILENYEPPIPWAFMKQYYMYGPVNVQYSDAQRQLPPYINWRFDLIRNSDDVITVKCREPSIGIEASTDSSGKFVLTLLADGQRIPPSAKTGRHALSFREYNGKLFVETYSSKTLENMRSLLDDTAKKISGAYATEKCLSFPGNETAAEKLIDLWESIPENVQKINTRKLAGLLGGRQNKTDIEISLNCTGRLADMTFSCTCGGVRIPPSAYKGSGNGIFQSSAGDWLRFNTDKVAEAMRVLEQEGYSNSRGTAFTHQIPSILRQLSENTDIRIAENSRNILQSIKDETPPAELELPAEMAHILRPYQKTGFSFLAERVRYGIGSILADDMGLGKTLQVLSVLEAARNDALKNNKPFRALVVAPASVIDVWLNQCSTFSSKLKAAALRGTKQARKKILADKTLDMLVTHYGLVRADIEELAAEDFTIAVLDEAQAIKNPNAASTIAVRRLKTAKRLVLTGTPLENNLSDLWSILDFLNPGINGSCADFQHSFGSGGAARISDLLKMLMLRRTKSLVAPELPPKTEEIIRLDMNEDFEKLYAREHAIAKLGSQGADTATMLSLCTRLRLLCCAPELVLKDKNAPSSVKIDFLKEKLTELTEAGHSVLVFSQFTSMLDIIERELKETGIRMFTITGETPVPKRAGIVDAFNDSEVPAVFLLSLKAAGTGLTLTKADYVFLADPWWNPAVENQAIDRTHRIGQDKPVFAYRIIIGGSIEERVLDVVQYKRELFDAVVGGVDAAGTKCSLTIDEIRNLLK